MRDHAPPRLPFAHVLRMCAGIFVAIASLGLVSFDLHILLALGSFGSSAVLLFGFPDNHFSQPRSILVGHLASTAVGLAVLALAGRTWWAMGLAVALAAAAMIACRAVHPPAGSNPIIVFLGLPGWDFLLFPTLAGALVLVGVGLAWHRATGQRYPRYWLGAGRSEDVPVVALQDVYLRVGTADLVHAEGDVFDETSLRVGAKQ